VSATFATFVISDVRFPTSRSLAGADALDADRTTRIRDRQRQYAEQVHRIYAPASSVTGTMLAVDSGMDGLRLRSGK